MSEARVSPWPRRLRRVFILALLLTPLALWPRSAALRLGVYDLIYPYLSEDRRARIFERIHDDEERPDLAWRLYAEAADDPALAWAAAFAAAEVEGPLELRGLEGVVVDAIRRPEFARNRPDALRAAIALRLKDPRLPAILRPLLHDGVHRVAAAHLLALNGHPEESLPVLIEALTTSDPKDDYVRAFGSLHALREIGPAARPALAAIRPFTEAGEAQLEGEALAALWVIEGEARHADQLRALLRATPPQPGQVAYGNTRWALAVTLAEVGLGDDEARRVIEEPLTRAHKSFEGALCLRALAALGVKARPSLPLIEPFLTHENSARREAARRVIAAIQGALAHD